MRGEIALVRLTFYLNMTAYHSGNQRHIAYFVLCTLNDSVLHSISTPVYIFLYTECNQAALFFVHCSWRSLSNISASALMCDTMW